MVVAYNEFVDRTRAAITQQHKASAFLSRIAPLVPLCRALAADGAPESSMEDSHAALRASELSRMLLDDVVPDSITASSDGGTCSVDECAPLFI